VSLRERLIPLTTPEQVDQFLKAHPACGIFKAGTCHKTPETFKSVEAHLGDRTDLPVGLIKVVESRPASNHVASLTGVRHESPQLLLFRDGKVVFHRDNWDITDEAVAEGLEEHFPAVAASM
jgi:bacillithiol system protein YtxJ